MLVAVVQFTHMSRPKHTIHLSPHKGMPDGSRCFRLQHVVLQEQKFCTVRAPGNSMLHNYTMSDSRILKQQGQKKKKNVNKNTEVKEEFLSF